MTQEQLEIIKSCRQKKISVYGCCSILYSKGLSGIRVYELMAIVFKEYQKLNQLKQTE